MNILFVNPSTEKYARSISTPLGLVSIATYLQSKGHTVKIYDRTVSKDSLENVISAFEPNLCGISMMSYKSVFDTLEVARKLKEKNIPCIVGGPLPSVLPELTLAYDLFDAVSIGEGEATWLELAEYYSGKIGSLSDIAGLAIKDENGKIKYTEVRPFIDLSEIPPLDWSLIDVPKYFQSSYGCKKMLYLYAAKGCPFSCTFCYNKDFHKSKYRKRPIETLLEEIRFLVENYGMDGVYFADEMWCTNKNEMHEICDKLKGLGLNFVWGCQTRIGVFEEEDFRYMYDSGCRWIFFGIESGSKKMLEKINKRIDYDKIVPTFAACKKANIACIGSFIIGLPDETQEDLQATVNLIKQLDTSLINVNYLALIPGAQIYKDLIASGRHKEVDTLEDFARKNPLEKLEYNFSNIPSKDIKVIRAYYMWKSFTATDVPGTEKFSFAKKVIVDALKSVKTGNLISFTVSTFFAGVEFLKVSYYSHFYPSVKKKYGLK